MDDVTDLSAIRPGRPANRLVVAGALALFAIVWVAHSGSLANDFVSFDDPEYVSDNAHVSAGLSAEGVVWAFRPDHHDTYFHPLTWLSLMADAQFLGNGPWGFHLVNLLLHASNAILLFLLLVRTLRRVLPSLAAATLWAVHPLTVEAVAWATERKAVLSTAFVLLAAHAWVSFARSERRPLRMAWVVFLSTCAYLAKPATIVLPALFLLLDAWPLGRLSGALGGRARARVFGRLLLEKIPVALPGAVVVWLAIETSRGFTAGDGVMPSQALRSVHAVASVRSYLAAAFWPADLILFRPYPVAFDWPAFAVGAAILAGVTAALVLLRNRWPAGLWGWAWFLVSLSPYLGLKQNGLWPAWADRFAYVALMGLAVAAVFGIAELVRERAAYRRVAMAFFVACVAVLSGVTRAQVKVWRGSEPLYVHSLEVAPEAAFIQFTYGKVLLKEGRIGEAKRAFQRSVAADWRIKEAQSDLAVILMNEGDLMGAISHLDLALRMGPELPEARFNLAEAYRSLGDLPAAALNYRLFLAIAPPELAAQIARARFYLSR